MVEFRILGPLELSDERGMVEVSGSKRRALLALLLLNANEVVSTDRLLEELWGDEQPGSGVTALQVAVSKLRKALGESAGALETRAPGYLLRLDPGRLDLDRFERLVGEAADAEPERAARLLREALSLWRGPPLAEFVYEGFAQAAIGRLEELRFAALEKRIEADLAIGRHSDLVAELEALVVEHPLRERFRAQLMLALYRGGRQAEALAVYQSTRRALLDRLGIEPSPALQELEQAVLRQDASLDPSRAPAPERSILVAPRTPDGVSSLLRLAEPLARRPVKELVLARVVGAEPELESVAQALQDRRAELMARGVSARAAAFVSATPAADLVRLSVEQDVDLLLLDGPPAPLDALVSTVLADAPCDVAVLVGQVAEPASVLVPFVGADHDWAAVELGAWLAATRAGCWRAHRSSSSARSASRRRRCSSTSAGRSSSRPQAPPASSSPACRSAGGHRAWAPFDPLSSPTRAPRSSSSAGGFVRADSRRTRASPASPGHCVANGPTRAAGA